MGRSANSKPEALLAAWWVGGNSCWRRQAAGLSPLPDQRARARLLDGGLFADAALQPAAARLALISVASQLPLGVASTNSLRKAQRRKKALLTVGKEGAPRISARGFSRMASAFIAFTAVRRR